MKKSRNYLTITLSLLLMNSNAQTLDVDFTGITGNCMSYTGLSETQTLAQSFTAGISGNLTSVKAGLSARVCTETNIMNCTAKIYDGTCTGTVLTTENFTIPTGSALSMYQINFSTPANITSGQVYTLELSVLPGQNCYIDPFTGMEPVFGGWHLENSLNCGGEYASGTAFDPGCLPYPGDYYIQTYVISTLGIIENDFGGGFLVYPNPTNGIFSIDLGSVYESVEISISDITGRTFSSMSFDNEKTLKLYLNEPTGVYFVNVTSGEKRAVIRLLKN
ncbi:T9SS type A sorting domain-containing protein [uncultured Flavobacterium sp.]|uniref:T9SS type A sorting domain-containing protein n=1 Tax=uncultured Flavobacterium sp. TaxID=165435 RepID=UPI002618AB2B|nr:T9SS type A sorting domain-containing protein [uncultured Flavobacterium sp.]